MLPKEVMLILQRLEDAGFEAYPVGGCVRDRLLGKEPTDWDMTTSAMPEQTAALFDDCKLNQNGMKHGTVGIILNGAMWEVTTYRIDGEYKDMRHPDSVTFTDSLLEDLARRDFTVNAMAMDKNEKIIDFFDGRDDLQKKRIRCVGDPKQRFNEDALRILRGLRFASMEGFSLEHQTLACCNKLAENLQKIAYERIYTELKKMFLLPGAAFVAAKALPVFEAVFPTLQVTKAQWQDILAGVRRVPCRDEIALGCILAHADAQAELERLRTDRRTKRLIGEGLAMEPLPDAEAALAHLMAQKGRELVCFTAALQYAMGQCPKERIVQASRASQKCVEVRELAVSGSDLAETGLRSYHIKEAQELLLDAVIEDKVENEKDSLLAYLRKCK